MSLLPLFIGGTGRCGTTVLGRTLSLHRDIFTIPFESRFIVDPHGVVNLVQALSINWDQYHGHYAVLKFKELMKELYPSKLRYLYKIGAGKIYPKLHIAPPRYYFTIDGKWKDEEFFDYKTQPFSVLISRDKFEILLKEFLSKIIIREYAGYWQGYGTEIGPRMYVTRRFEYREILKITRQFVEGIMVEAANRFNARIIVDHTPTNINHVLFLKDLFPEMKFIHIYRDPRDVVSSFKRHTWGGNSAQDAVPIIKGTLMKWEEEKKNMPRESYLEIALEDLVKDKETILKRICDFLGIGFDVNMLKMDLSKSHSGRWKRDLSKEEIELVERELGWFMKEKGYQFSE